MTDLTTMKDEILADGVVDEAEVGAMRAVVFEDGVIDKAEMQFLVDVADGAADADNHTSFEALYLDAVRNRYLEDEASPGAIDETEAIEIVDMFWGDGNLNRYERAALTMISNEATSIHPILKQKMEFLGI